MTRGQSRALTEHADALVSLDALPGKDASVHRERGPLLWDERFGRRAPLGVEIGFGMGQALLEWAQSAPELNVLGVDVYRPGIGAALLGRAERQLHNLLVVEGDAREVMEALIAPASLAEVRIFFPDPWPKKRHHKRRLIQSPFVDLLASRLAPGGRLLLATDWQPYAEQMLEALEAEPLLANDCGDGFAERFDGRPVTRFEARGQRLGHRVWDLAYRRRAGHDGSAALERSEKPDLPLQKARDQTVE